MLKFTADAREGNSMSFLPLANHISFNCRCLSVIRSLFSGGKSLRSPKHDTDTTSVELCDIINIAAPDYDDEGCFNYYLEMHVEFASSNKLRVKLSLDMSTL